MDEKKRKPAKPGKEKPSAFGKTLDLLSRREHSRRELATKLTQRGYARDEAASAINAAVDAEYQSNERFAGSIARSRASGGYGPRRITAELKSHGVADAEIAAALATLDVDWCDIARRQLERHYGGKPPADAKERMRRAAFLLRRGFDGATVSALVRADTGDPGDGFD